MHLTRRLTTTSSVNGAFARIPLTENSGTVVTFDATEGWTNEGIKHSHWLTRAFAKFCALNSYEVWGRPDLVPCKYVTAFVEDHPVGVYDYVNKFCDVTNDADLMGSNRTLIDADPERNEYGVVPEGESLSPLAPFHIVNVGKPRKAKPIAPMRGIIAANTEAGVRRSASQEMSIELLGSAVMQANLWCAPEMQREVHTICSC